MEEREFRRYKIKVSSDEQFQKVRNLIQGATSIQLESAKRKTIVVVEDLPQDIINQVQDLGGRITSDAQYDLDLPTE